MKVSRFTIITAALLSPCLTLAAQQPTTGPLQNPNFSSAPVSPSVPATAVPAQVTPPVPVPATPPDAVPATAPPQNTVSSPVEVPPSVPAGPQTASGQPALPAVVPTTYVVGPEDSIQVTVWHEPTFSGAFPVRPDGMISLPLVGDVMASGRTPMALASDLTTRLKAFVNDPTVTVTVMAVNSKHVYMLGEISHIGALALTSSLTPLQAISAAGGLTPYANKSKIYILRVNASGQKIKIPFNYKKAIKDGDLQGVVLLPGDTIVVP